MKKIKVRNADGKLIELEVSQEIYNAFVYDSYKEKMCEKYRNDNLRDFTENSVMENKMELSVNAVDEIMQDLELMEKINCVLDKCTPTQRRRFELHFFKQFPMREIAKKEKVNLYAVQKSLYQVREKFKKFFSK